MKRIFGKHGETPSYSVNSIPGLPIRVFPSIFAADTLMLRVFPASSFHFSIGPSQFSVSPMVERIDLDSGIYLNTLLVWYNVFSADLCGKISETGQNRRTGSLPVTI
jgi:hypothetical protein